MKYLFTILTLLCLASCSRNTLPKVTTIVRDSIVEKETIVIKRDTSFLPGETVEMWQAIPCPDAKMDTVIKKGNTHLSATILKGFLHIDCHTDSLMHIIDSLTILKQKEVYKTTTVQVPVEVIKNKIPKWVWYLLTANVLAVAWKFRFSIVKLFGA